MATESPFNLDTNDWSSLVYGVEHGNCTLMLGPDAVTGALDGVHLPLSVAFATFVKHRLGSAGEHLDPLRPWTVAQAAIAAQDGHALLMWVSQFYEQFDCDFEVVRQLAALPFPLVINTSPGLFVQQIFTEVKPRTIKKFFDRTGQANVDLPDPTVEAPLVYDLYGSLERPDSLVLSENDRLDFVEAVVAGRPGLPKKLSTLLTEENRSFLFVGFKLWQWQFRLLLHVLGKHMTRTRKSFAIEREGDDANDDTKDFYLRRHKITFLSGDVGSFVQELGGRVRADAGTSSLTTDSQMLTPVAPDAPIVFICHASEDREFAHRLAADLESHEIGTWLDKQELVGGEEWDAEIRRTIATKVDYVVVLQSASLLAKNVGYVNREIKLALERQEEFRRGRFLIPAVIDNEASKLEDLDQWHSIDLTAGVDELVRAIRRDQKNRGGA